MKHHRKGPWVWTIFIICLLSAFVIVQDPIKVQQASAPDRAPVQLGSRDLRQAVQPRIVEVYGRLPLSFEANQGQADGQVKFLSRGSGYALFLTGNEAVLSLRKGRVNSKGQLAKIEGRASSGADLFSKSAAFPAFFQPPAAVLRDNLALAATDIEPRTTGAVLRMKLVGANSGAKAVGLDELPGKSNYFIGNDPKKWRTNVPNYAKVKYEGVYPGVDLVYYGNQRQLEYDFMVAPGADPGAITLDVGAVLALPKGRQQAAPLRIDTNGDLLVEAENGEVRFRKPVVYQPAETRHSSVVSGRSQEVTDNEARTRDVLGGRYVLKGNNQVSFEVASYDRSRPLVIDPVLSYSFYLTGAYEAFGIAVDAAGNAYVTGYAGPYGFPTTPGAFQTSYGGGAFEGFVTKLNAAGSSLVYSTYLGGSDDSSLERAFGYGIAVDAAGNAYVIGYTNSTDFPTTPGAFQTSFGGGGGDAFVTKLNAAGSSLVYSTYLGGNDEGNGIAVDAAGNAYVTGYAGPYGFPTTPGAFQTSYGGGAFEGFVTKLNAAGSSLVYSTYLGGSDDSDVEGTFGNGTALDAAGNAYVTGYTNSTDFPTTPGAFQTSFGGGGDDAFVTELNAAGSALVYSTYLGGSGGDFGHGIAIDSAGDAYITGLSESADFPTTPGAFQPACIYNSSGSSVEDAFVTKLSAAGSRLAYSTYLGGNDEGYGIAVGAAGNAYVTGGAGAGFPVTSGAFQPYNSGINGIFATNLNAAGSALVYSTYVDSITYGGGFGIAVDAAGNAYIAGTNGEVVLAKISPPNGPEVDLYPPSSLTFGTRDVGTTTTPQTISLANAGSAALSISSIEVTGTNGSDFPESNTCPLSPSALAAEATCTITVNFKPSAEGTRSASVTITDSASGSPQGITLAGTGLNRPSLTATIISQTSSGTLLTVVISFTNIGSQANNTLVKQVTLLSLGGSGTPTYVSPALPVSLGNLAVGGSTTVTFQFNVPATVTKFSATESGTTQNTAGTTYNYSLGQVVFP